MKERIKNWPYYLLFAFIGIFIYKFQIEKSFNLLTIYILCTVLSFFCFIFGVDSRKSMPLLFVLSLFAMYGVSNEDGIFEFQLKQFILLLASFAILLFILLANYKLLFKKIAVILIAAGLAGIYLIKGEILADYKYIPFVLGSFFMFRSISFLHEIKFMKKQAALIDKINYFLLVPNFSMPMFPIVDYKTFILSYEGVSSNTLSRSSILICRGLFQMILYRFIYHNIIIPYDEIHTALQVFVFLAANFLIVLRVIGAFHIAIGLVILAGYNIPDLFNNLFFSTGFSNLWRRINIYWQNFMIKIFYYPIYFKIKKFGVFPALFISTLICFLITWILHAYQWFWLKGTFPIEKKDALFWGSFGLLVSVNTLLQQWKLDKSSVKKERSFEYIKQSFAGLFVFFVMSVLWSLWTCNSLSNWRMLMNLFRNIDIHQIGVIILLSISYIIISSIYHYYEKYKESRWLFLKRNLKTFYFGGIVLLFLGFQVSKIMIEKGRIMFYWINFFPLVTEQLNKADLVSIDNGYYTNLINTNNYCSQVWLNDYDISRNWTKYITNKTTVPSRDLMIAENIPFASVKYKGINYTLNSYGLRDKEYPLIKPDSCYRIIVLGGSYECGNGMNDGEDFLSIVESELNNNYLQTIDDKPVHLELINFSTNGYHLVQRYYQLKDKARLWHPDALLLFIHTNYDVRSAKYVIRLINRGFKVKDTYLKQIIEQSKIAKTDNDNITINKLGAYADSLNYYAVRGISRIAHEDNIKIFAVFLPSLKDKITERDSIFMKNICSLYDMKPISLADVFFGMDEKELVLSDLDFHPNKKANGIIASKLLENILRHQDYFNIKFTKK